MVTWEEGDFTCFVADSSIKYFTEQEMLVSYCIKEKRPRVTIS